MQTLGAEMIEAVTDADAEHAAALAPSATAKGIALSALNVAYRDIAKAFRQIATGTVEEADLIIKEAGDQLVHARSMLAGTAWQG